MLSTVQIAICLDGIFPLEHLSNGANRQARQGDTSKCETDLVDDGADFASFQSAVHVLEHIPEERRSISVSGESDGPASPGPADYATNAALSVQDLLGEFDFLVCRLAVIAHVPGETERIE